MSNLNVKVIRDYNEYFERAGISIATQVNEKCPNLIENIEIEACPYKSSDISYGYNKESKTLYLEYYSAIRAGFGSLHTSEVIEDLIQEYG